jgi:hypothetical protein
MNEIPNRAKLFLVAVMLAAVAMTVYAMLGMHAWHGYQSLTLLVIAVVASRLKLKLPGLNGNMSVNLPFILVAVMQLSLLEAIAIGVASTAVQCFPKDGGKPKAVQMLFNVGTVTVAVGMSNWILRQSFASRVPWASTSLLLSLAAATFFFAQTIPVATIISLSEGGRTLRIWSAIFHLSFPYYVLSAGMTSLVTTASHRIPWQIPLLVLPVMYGVYRSYQLYFGRAVEAPRSMALAKAASC